MLSAVAAASWPGSPPGRRAIDLGCGAGRDTLPLLAAGWHVVAIDRETAALDALAAATPLAFRPRLVTRRARLEDVVLPATDLVNASFCLFFPDRLAQLADLFTRIRAALVPGGRFAGQLLGPHDSWVEARRTLGVDEGQLAVLLRGFVLERVEEEIAHGVTPRGEPKQWHIWHVNAVKRRRP